MNTHCQLGVAACCFLTCVCSFLLISFTLRWMVHPGEESYINQHQGIWRSTSTMSGKGADSARAGNWIHHKREETLVSSHPARYSKIKVSIQCSIFNSLAFRSGWLYALCNKELYIVNSDVFIYHYFLSENVLFSLLITESDVTAEQVLQMSEWLKNNISPADTFCRPPFIGYSGYEKMGQSQSKP